MNNKDSHCGMHTEQEWGGERGRGRGKQRQSNSILYLGDTTKSFLCLPACAGCLLLAYLPSESAAISVSHTQAHARTRTHSVCTLYSNWLTLGIGSDVVIEQSNL